MSAINLNKEAITFLAGFVYYLILLFAPNIIIDIPKRWGLPDDWIFISITFFTFLCFIAQIIWFNDVYQDMKKYQNKLLDENIDQKEIDVKNYYI
jgi:hypothetical protein